MLLRIHPEIDFLEDRLGIIQGGRGNKNNKDYEEDQYYCQDRWDI